MSRVLILGGYGGFGARLSRRLEAHEVIVAGRSLEEAERFCRGLPHAKPARIDRTGDLAPILRKLGPDIVIDAAGPFQNLSSTVPKACIDAGVCYLDLADARDFVCGIGQLDGAARKAGVVVISGASSVPALSGAVARRLAEGLDRVTQVEIAISASARSAASRSVTGAILTYAGRGVRLRRGGRWTVRFGASELQRAHFEVGGAKPLRRRWLALCDVPDLELLPAMLPGEPAVIFRAGSDHPPQVLGLWLVSWLVRFGIVSSLRRFAGIFLWLQRAVLWVGSDRSAMAVVLLGWRDGERIERRWTLIAEGGSGPEVPTLAAALLIDRIASGGSDPGARNASKELTISDFEQVLAGLPVRQEITERVLEPTLYRRVMGARFDQLPRIVQQLHEVNGDAGAEGRAVVSRSAGFWPRLFCRLMRFPPSGSYPLHVSFVERFGKERWTRDFGGYCFSSELGARDHRLTERFGPIRLAFELVSVPDGLKMVLRGWTFGVRLPLALAPRIDAREWEEDGWFRFSVAAALPLLGDIIRYSGRLRPVGLDAHEERTARKTRAAL